MVLVAGPIYLMTLELGFRSPNYDYPVGDAVTLDDLTPRQRQVAVLVACGMNNREIAQQLYVTVQTVKTHLSLAYDRVGLPTQEEGGSPRVMLAHWVWNQER